MILIVEDDLTLASSIEDTLMHFGYDTKIVESVEEAIKVIKVTPPRLIISDILLGDHDGFYLLQFVRAVPQFDAIGFIFISALIETSFVVKGLQCGADDYIRKPF
jgi:DNA-binding response OmpR family regulator